MMHKKPWELLPVCYLVPVSGACISYSLWIVLSCHAAIALGTMFGGWRIVKTMGQKLSKLRPVDDSALRPLLPQLYMFPLHWVFRKYNTYYYRFYLGIGTLKGFLRKWKIANNIIVAWILTIPAAAVVSAFFYGWLFSLKSLLSVKFISRPYGLCIYN